MSTATINTFLALATIAVYVVVAAGLVLWIGSRWSPALDRAYRLVRESIRDHALTFAALVGVGSIAASLYYSEIAAFPPCPLCWYGRIAMYPLGLILVIAAFTRDRGVRIYAAPLALIGGGIGVYNYLLHLFPGLESGACSVEASCATPYVWEFGFISIPLMGIAAFAFILLLLGAAGGPVHEETGT
jgi:disulfide bond formation protein DsbB